LIQIASTDHPIARIDWIGGASKISNPTPEAATPPIIPCKGFYLLKHYPRLSQAFIQQPGKQGREGLPATEIF